MRSDLIIGARREQMSNTILLATNNVHKLHEFRGILSPLGFTVISPDELGVDLSVDETGTTFAENATQKLRALGNVHGMTIVADDSGLVVDALDGEPGIRSARYGGPGLSDADRTSLVLERMRSVPAAQRSARFVAAIALSAPGRVTGVFEGVVEGMIAPATAGDGGFGYDPIFFFPPAGRTFAQMLPREKAIVSHRGKATGALIAYLRSFCRLEYTESGDNLSGVP